MIFEKLIEINDLQDMFCNIFSSKEAAVYVNLHHSFSGDNYNAKSPFQESDLLNEIVGFFEELSAYLAAKDKLFSGEITVLEDRWYQGLIDEVVVVSYEGNFDSPLVELHVVKKTDTVVQHLYESYGQAEKSWKGSIGWMNLTRNMASMAKSLFNQGFDNLDDIEKTLYLHFYSRNFLIDEVKEALSRRAVEPSDPKPQHI